MASTRAESASISAPPFSDSVRQNQRWWRARPQISASGHTYRAAPPAARGALTDRHAPMARCRKATKGDGDRSSRRPAHSAGSHGQARLLKRLGTGRGTHPGQRRCAAPTGRKRPPERRRAHGGHVLIRDVPLRQTATRRSSAALCLLGSPTVQLWEADRSAFQAREVRFVLPLDLLEVREKPFHGLRWPPIGAQLRHELELPRHTGGALADMAAHHLQLGFTLCPALLHPGNDSIGWFPREARPAVPSCHPTDPQTLSITDREGHETPSWTCMETA